MLRSWTSEAYLGKETTGCGPQGRIHVKDTEKAKAQSVADDEYLSINWQ